MRAIAVFAVSIIAAASAPPAALALDGALPLPPVELPSAPVELPALPPVPVPVPDVPLPLPEVDASVPLPVPGPAPGPTPGGRSEPPSTASPATRPVEKPAQASPGPAPSSAPAPARTGAAPRASGRSREGRSAERRRARRAPARRRAASRARPRLTSASPVSVMPSAAAPAPADVAESTQADAKPEGGAVSRLLGDFGDLVEVMPAAVLWSLIGIAVIALAMAGNAYRHSRRREAAEAHRAELLEDVGLLSSALLPPVPDAMERLVVSAAYRPADGPAAGGDFYDVFALDGERLGVLLGDVSGHGRDSLTQAALARYTLRTLLAAGHGPGEALARADQLLARDLPPHFVTVIAAVYDQHRDELTYAKAGHAPPIVLGMAHDPDAEESACPLGLGLGESWPEFVLELADDASVCLYTDGLEDARLEGTRLGREQVTRLLAAQDLPDATQLIADIGEYADRMSDDTAAVVLRRR